jgi:hypothetical protein
MTHPAREQMEQLQTLPRSMAAVTSKRIFPQWQEPEYVFMRRLS